MKYPKVKPKAMYLEDFTKFINNKDQETEENIKNTETIITLSG